MGLKEQVEEETVLTAVADNYLLIMLWPYSSKATL